MTLLWGLLIIGISIALGYLVSWYLNLSFSHFERLIISSSIGLILFGETNAVLAWCLGRISLVSITLSLIIFTVVTTILFLVHKKDPTREEKNTQQLLTAGSLILLGGYILLVLYTRVLITDREGNLLVGPPALYGDTALHAAYTSRIAYGSFPPDHPLFAHQALVYPFMTHVISAVLLRVGFDFHLAFFLPQFFFTLGFITLFIRFARYFVKSSLGVVVSLLTFFLGWGVGFFYFWEKWMIAGMSFLQFSQKFGDLTHNDTFHLNLHNVLTGMIFPERTFLPGLCIGLLITALILNIKKVSLKDGIIIGVLLGILPFWHTHTFLVMGFLLACWVFFYLENSLIQKLQIAATVFGIAFILAVPFIYLTLGQISHEHFIHFILGWMNGRENIILYWFRNSLFIIPLSLTAWFFLPRAQKKFFVPIFILFVVANLVSFSPLDWDNIKFFAWIILFWAVLIGLLYEKLWKRGVGVRVILMLILISSSLSGLIALKIPLQEKLTLYDAKDQEFAAWIRTHTVSNAIFLTEATHNHPIPGLAGRSIYLGYPGYLWVHGIDYAPREQLLNNFYTGKIEAINSMKPHVDYVVYNQWQQVPAEILRNSKPLFTNGKYALYQAKDIIASSSLPK